MAFLFNPQYQTRTSSYHSSQTSAFDPEENFERLHEEDRSPGKFCNSWRVSDEDEAIYPQNNQQSPYECSAASQQQFIPLTSKNLEHIKLETSEERLERIYYWLKHSPPPYSDVNPSPIDWNRKKLVPKVRIAPPRSVVGNDFNQDYRKESRRNCDWDAEIPVPVRSPAWCDDVRKSAGQKRKRYPEEGWKQSTDQNTGWESMKSFAMEDRRVKNLYEEDNRLCFTKYEETVHETRTSRRVRLAPPNDDFGACSIAKRQARVGRFQRDLDYLRIKNPAQDKLNCTLDQIITERVSSRKRFRDVQDQCRMYGSVPTSRLSLPSPKLEMQMQDYEYSTRSPPRGQRRPIVIDGSNVAYEKTLGSYFDSTGICICVDWFLKRGFTDVVVVVPEHRLKNRGCRNPEPLRKLRKENKLVTCWSRKLPDGRWVTSYDDRMIVEIAHRRGGVIISNDRYRDLQKEKPEWAETIGTRVVGFRFMPGKMDEIMFPEDPFGRHGPRLEELLRF